MRFTSQASPEKVSIGQPVDESIDVGVAVRQGKEVEVELWDGTSVLSPGKPTGTSAVIGTVLSPLTQVEAGTVRCIGLNVSVPSPNVAPYLRLPHENSTQNGTDTLVPSSISSTPPRQRWKSQRFQRSS